LFTFFGIPVSVSPWSALLTLLLGWSAYVYVKKMHPYSNKAGYLATAAVLTVVAVLSLAVHEISHGLMAYAFRIPIVQAGFTGWGAFVQPADSFSEMPFWQEVLIVAAGPASNFVLGGLAAIVVKWLPESLFENSVQYVGYLNLQLGRINLYPIFVLDGAKIVHGLLRGIMGNQAADVGLVAVSFFFIIYLVLRKRRRPSLEDRLETL